MTKKCPGCGKEYRKGSIVVLFAPGARPRGARVCQGCADGGMTVVAQKVAPKVFKAHAGDVAAFADKCIRQLRTYGKLAESTAKAEATPAADREFFRGRAEGLDAAIELLKSERA
jgi:hypothetical protein